MRWWSPNDDTKCEEAAAVSKNASFSPHGRTQCLNEPQLDRATVASRQHAGGFVAGDPRLYQDRSAAVVHKIADTAHGSDLGHVEPVGELARSGHGDEIDAGPGVARLHAGLAIVLIVEHDDDEIARLLDPDGGKAAQSHQGLAVTRQHENPTRRLCQRKTETDHGGAAHRAPEIEVERMIATGRNVIGGRAEPGNDQQIFAVDEQLLDELTPIEHHLFHCLRPINRCDNRMATCKSPENAMSQPPPTISSTSFGSSTR